MNKYLVCFAGLLIALSAATSFAAAGRTESGSYHDVQGEVTDGGAKGEFSNAVTFSPRDGERLITVEVTDRSGLATRALVVQEKRGAWGADYSLKQEICTRTKAPIRINPELEVKVLLQDGPCGNRRAAAATFGTVKATFSK